MGTKNIFLQVNTEQPLDEVVDAVRNAFRSLNGIITETPIGLAIEQGVNGVNMAFTAQVHADIRIREIKEGRYEIECTVNWKPNALVWICLIVGFFVFGILWVIPLLYLFVDPLQAYQQALNRVPGFLD